MPLEDAYQFIMPFVSFLFFSFLLSFFFFFNSSHMWDSGFTRVFHSWKLQCSSAQKTHTHTHTHTHKKPHCSCSPDAEVRKKKNELTTKNQFGIEKSLGCSLLDLFLPSDPAAFFFFFPSFFFLLFPRSGATCQAVGFLHASSEETRVLFTASFSLIFVVSDGRSEPLLVGFQKKKEEE